MIFYIGAILLLAYSVFEVLFDNIGKKAMKVGQNSQNNRKNLGM